MRAQFCKGIIQQREIVTEPRGAIAMAPTGCEFGNRCATLLMESTMIGGDGLALTNRLSRHDAPESVTLQLGRRDDFTKISRKALRAARIQERRQLRSQGPRFGHVTRANPISPMVRRPKGTRAR